MFEETLANKFKAIFKVKNVSYSQPGESQEQECLFVQVDDSRNTIKDGRAIAKITGQAFMFGNSEKMPFGFFSKAVERADRSLTAELLFYDFESNTKTYGNIVQRGFSFVYFFNAQYDPEIGTMTTLDFEVEETL